MKMKTKIEIHETCISLLEGIKYFTKLKKESIDEAYKYKLMQFMSLSNYKKRRSEIFQMCIDRLQLRYENQIELLTKKNK